MVLMLCGAVFVYGLIKRLLPSAGDDFCGVSVDELFVGLFAEKQAF